MAITNYSDVEVKGIISSTKQGRMIGVSSTAITEGSSATGYQAGDTVMYNSTLYTVADGKWTKTTLGNTSSVTVDSALSTTSTNPFQNQLVGNLTTTGGKLASINTATDANNIALKGFVNSSINALAAYYITKNAAGAPFATHAELAASTTVYSGGSARVPTRNDYCIVLADETNGNGDSTRYTYNSDSTTYSASNWAFQYVFNKQFTQAQLAALDSGATSTNIGQIGTNTSNIGTLQTAVAGKIDTAGSGLTKSGTTLNHSNSVTATTSAIGGATAIPQIQYDAQGHIKANVTTATVYPPTDAGTNGQLWSSQGSGVGKWVNQSTVAAGSATNASYATAIGTSSSHPQIGSATQPVYVSSAGAVTAGTALSDGAYKAMGSVASGNTGLVTGGDVYTAVQNSSGFQITAESGYYTLSDGNNVSLTDHSTYWTMGWS